MSMIGFKEEVTNGFLERVVGRTIESITLDKKLGILVLETDIGELRFGISEKMYPVRDDTGEVIKTGCLVSKEIVLYTVSPSIASISPEEEE